jgi:hypothetical protein
MEPAICVAPNLYIHFNVAKGYNIDAAEPNTIVIVEALSDDKISTRKALLKQPGDTYTYVGSETGKVGTIIEVCSVVMGEGLFVSYAMISVHLAGAKSACGSPDLDVWAPNWNDASNNNNNARVTMAPVPSPDGGTDNHDFDATPEDNDGSKTSTIRLTLQPAAAPIDQVPIQPTPALSLPPDSIPSGLPVVRPASQPGDQFTGGAIDEEEDQSANAKIIGVSVSSVIGGLLLLAGLVCCAVRNETPLSTKNSTEEQNASQQTPESSSDKSSNKDHRDVTETEGDDWWGGDWFSFDFAKTVGACNRSVVACAKTVGV